MDNNHRFAIVHALCAKFADESGDKSFARAARALLWEPSGRKPKSPRVDDRAVKDANDLLAHGGAKSINDALTLVAKARWPFENPKSVFERLRRRAKRKPPRNI
jgi:hypothetical protein